MGLLQAGQAYLAGAVGKAAGVGISYARGATVVTITAESGAAWVGRTAFTSVQQGAIRVEWGDRDYLILASALAAIGEPAEGDRITETVNGTAKVFEVMSPGGEPPWRYSDPQRSVFRLHVKQVG
jgi:hypothetical protein